MVEVYKTRHKLIDFVLTLKISNIKKKHPLSNTMPTKQSFWQWFLSGSGVWILYQKSYFFILKKSILQLSEVWLSSISQNWNKLLDFHEGVPKGLLETLSLLHISSGRNAWKSCYTHHFCFHNLFCSQI